jgi:hypothetical protein
MGRRGTEELKLRFYPGQHDDIIAWLRQFDGKPHGAKSQGAIDALRRGMGAGISEHCSEMPGNSAGVAALDLGQLRQVVEAAIDTALGRFEGQISSTKVTIQEEDDETEALLDNLEAALVLDGE